MINQAHSQLLKYGTTTLNVYTGAGKTVMVAYLLACLSMVNQTAIIFLTNTTLIEQWKDTFSKFTTASVWVVGEAFPDRPVNVIICMNERFKKLPSSFVSGIGVVVYDEAHTFCTEGRKNCLLGITPTFVIAASATMHRPDDMIGMMHAVVGEHAVVEISQKPFKVYKYNTGIVIPIVKNAMGKVDYSKVISAQVESDERNGLVCNLVEQHSADKILIMCKYKKHVETLHSLLKERGKSVDTMFGTKKSYSDSQILIGTINKIGTGFDEKAACKDFNGVRINVLILTCSIKSLGLLEQVVGRSFRSDAPQVYYLIDHNSIVQNHWRGAVKWFKSRNGVIQEIDSPYERARKSNERNSNNRNAERQREIIQANLRAAQQQMAALTIGQNVTFHKV
jgi:superfamily II DNA or RNA helicase